MKLEQIYTNCLAHAAYYLESEGEVALFDPLREVDEYISKAKMDHARIKYVFETHFHADFVSGHLDLAQKTGASIVYGPTAKPEFQAVIAEDNQEFMIGGCKIVALHTPGHTLESTTYLIYDESGIPHGIISGDTLFIGDVGRPDLAQHVVSELTEEKLAGMLYDSLRKKIMPLPDTLIVYPNHGAGSACGKMMSKETTDTLGNQKKTNYALRSNMSKDEFIEEVLDGLTSPPAYFPKNVLLNIKGSEALDKVLSKANKAISMDDFEALIVKDDVLILDCRSATEYASTTIPDSIFIGLDGNFAMWVGELIPDIKQKIALICPEGKELEALIRLSRIGYDGAIGYLDVDLETWYKAGKSTISFDRITAEIFTQLYDDNYPIIDVRKKNEFNTQHIIGAINFPLNQLESSLERLPKGPFILYCAGGYRSMIAASILRRHHIMQFVDVIGGFTAISKTEIPLTDYVCPTTLL